jgi:hypothetical protein
MFHYTKFTYTLTPNLAHELLQHAASHTSFDTQLFVIDHDTLGSQGTYYAFLGKSSCQGKSLLGECWFLLQKFLFDPNLPSLDDADHMSFLGDAGYAESH